MFTKRYTKRVLVNVKVVENFYEFLKLFLQFFSET